MEQEFRVCRICYIFILCLAFGKVSHSSPVTIIPTPSTLPTTQNTNTGYHFTEKSTMKPDDVQSTTFHNETEDESTTQIIIYNFSSTTDSTKTSTSVLVTNKEVKDLQTTSSNVPHGQNNLDTTIVIIFFAILVIVIIIVSLFLILRKKKQKKSYSFDFKSKSADDTEIPLGNIKE